MKIDICIPTKDSGSVLGETLDRAADAVGVSDASVNQLVIVDDESDDGTIAAAKDAADTHGWDTNITVAPSTLPEARPLAIDAVETDWFLFLDDDVRLSQTYLTQQLAATGPAIGAVQGRKDSRTEHPSDWVHRRSRRGGTHATLIRTAAVADMALPDDLHLLHDEYIRQHVEATGYCWVFSHQSRFGHANQGRHPIGWREGYEGGAYGLSNLHDLALNVPFAVVTRRNPLPHLKRSLGWVYGSMTHDGTKPGVTDAAPDANSAAVPDPTQDTNPTR